MKILCCNFDKKKCCANCAFLCKLRYKDSVELSAEEREKLKDDNIQLETVCGAGPKLSCHKFQLPVEQGNTIWKHGNLQMSVKDLKKHKCNFFLSCKDCKGLPLNAVEAKYHCENETKNTRIARNTLVIAIISLIVSICAIITSLK